MTASSLPLGMLEGGGRADAENMRRRLVALIVLAAACTTSVALAADPRVEQRARDVRNAIPSAEAWYADHGTYAGMTVAKLRRAYDRSLKNVKIGRATKRGYCIQSTLKPFVHYDGPAGPMRSNLCGVRGAVVPPATPAPVPKPTGPEYNIRAATPAIEAYAADHAGYAGMTLAELQKWDSSITDLRIPWALSGSYCVESGTGDDTRHRVGPAGSVETGPCPSAP
jgi:hypothetical protein